MKVKVEFYFTLGISAILKEYNVRPNNNADIISDGEKRGE
jgi:hypothetical protein